MPIRVGLLAGSPVPFKIPLYRRLNTAADIDLTVIYASDLGVRPIGPELAGYGISFRWDIDLLSGYRSVFLRGAKRNNGYGVSFTQMADPDIVPALARHRFDVLWLEGYSSITHLLAIATERALGCALVMRDDQTLLNPRTAFKSLTKEIVLRSVFAQLDAAVYVSRENRRWLENYGVSPERLFWSPQAPDTQFFEAEARRWRPHRDSLRAEFGFDRDVGPIVLTASRLVEAKQPEVVLEAFKLLRSERPCGLLVVGSGPMEPQLRATVDREGIRDVRFAGFLNQSVISKAYAAADVFMLMSKIGESFGVVVAEAMYFGLPLVVSDKVGSAPDLVGDGSNGFVVPRDDPQSAAHALERLVVDSELRARFGARSLERIAERGLDQAVEGALTAIRFAATRAHRSRSTRTVRT